MTFEITNGLGKIKIGINGGDSFLFQKPLTVCWDDNLGSVGKYLCSLPYSKEYRNEIHNSIVSNLDKDFTNNLKGLYELLFPLFRLFINGNYSLSFESSRALDSSGFDDTQVKHFELHFGNLTNPKSATMCKLNHKLFLAKNSITKKYYPSNLLDFSTYNFYSSFDNSSYFLATQPRNEIDLKRVNYFENEILQGAKPFIIIYNCSTPNSSIISDDFVLDGHHKLLAYHKLNIFPSIATITFHPKQINEVRIDINELKSYLYSWQFEHLLKHYKE